MNSSASVAIEIIRGWRQLCNISIEGRCRYMEHRPGYLEGKGCWECEYYMGTRWIGATQQRVVCKITHDTETISPIRGCENISVKTLRP